MRKGAILALRFAAMLLVVQAGSHPIAAGGSGALGYRARPNHHRAGGWETRDAQPGNTLLPVSSVSIALIEGSRIAFARAFGEV